MIKAIIFDLDDTLIYEKEYIRSGLWHVSGFLASKTHYSKREIYNIALDSYYIDSSRVFNLVLEELSIEYDSFLIKTLINEYRSHKPLINFIDDVLPTIVELKDLGVRVGIITDGYRISQHSKLDTLQASKYFDEIIVTDDLGRDYWKPHPKAFNLMKQKLGLDFNEMAYIGDNPIKDFYISQVCPITTVRIKRKGTLYRNDNYYKGVQEEYSICELSELLPLIKKEIGGKNIE